MYLDTNTNTFRGAKYIYIQLLHVPKYLNINTNIFVNAEEKLKFAIHIKY